MFRIHAIGPKAPIQAAWNALAWADPSPADAVDYKEEGRQVWRLDAYASDDAAVSACLAVIGGVAPALNAIAEPLENRDWVALSLEGLPSVRAGRFLVAGAHSLADACGGTIPITVEAGPAFGTGHHGTTLGCLLAFNRLPPNLQRGDVLDLGTGTGVLAIAALKSGASRALATDIDPDSVRTAIENARKNNVRRRMTVIRARGTNNALIHRRGPFDLVFANILARPLIVLAPDIAHHVKPGGAVILSGLLTHQEPLVRKAFAGRGLVLSARGHRDGWSTLTLRRPGIGACVVGERA